LRGFDKYLDLTGDLSLVKTRIERVKKRKKLTLQQIKAIIKLQCQKTRRPEERIL
jgi:dephospho-CoA kinase